MSVYVSAPPSVAEAGCCQTEQRREPISQKTGRSLALLSILKMETALGFLAYIAWYARKWVRSLTLYLVPAGLPACPMAEKGLVTSMIISMAARILPIKLKRPFSRTSFSSPQSSVLF